MPQRSFKGCSDFPGLWLSGKCNTIMALAPKLPLICHFDWSQAFDNLWPERGHIMGHILAYYWKHWSASTIGLTVNTLAINGDVFHEWEEEQQGLRRIIPLNTNAIFFLMLWHRRTYAAFASSERERAWAGARDRACHCWVCVCCGGTGRNGEGSRGREQKMT